MKRTLIFLASLCLVLFACATPTPAPSPPAPPTTPTPGSPFSLSGTKWEVVSLTLDGVTQTPSTDRTPTLEFATDGTLGGSGGCNSFGGNYFAQGEILSITELRLTAMACTPQEVMEFEGEYLEALSGARLFEKTGEQLNITFAEGRGRLVFQARQ